MVGRVSQAQLASVERDWGDVGCCIASVNTRMGALAKISHGNVRTPRKLGFFQPPNLCGIAQRKDRLKANRNHVTTASGIGS